MRETSRNWTCRPPGPYSPSPPPPPTPRRSSVRNTNNPTGSIECRPFRRYNNVVRVSYPFTHFRAPVGNVGITTRMSANYRSLVSGQLVVVIDIYRPTSTDIGSLFSYRRPSFCRRDFNGCCNIHNDIPTRRRQRRNNNNNNNNHITRGQSSARQS